MCPVAIHRDARVPFHRQISEEIERRIGAGEYKPASRLPSEQRLAEEFAVSRMTLRHALNQLASSGLIERRHGYGTVVAQRRFLRDAQRGFGLTEELASRGLTPGSHILSVNETRPEDSERKELRLGPRSKVVRIKRLRYAGDILIGYQETAIPSRFGHGLEDVNLEGASVTKVLRELCGLRATRAELVIESVEADDTLAGLLAVLHGSALLRVSRTSFLVDDRPLELTVGWYPGSRLLYHLDQNLATSDLMPVVRRQQ